MMLLTIWYENWDSKAKKCEKNDAAKIGGWKRKEDIVRDTWTFEISDFVEAVRLAQAITKCVMGHVLLSKLSTFR